MESPRQDAFGHPGIPPRWTRSSKEGVGTPYSTASRVWFTLSHGILNEVYFPTDARRAMPQARAAGVRRPSGRARTRTRKRAATRERVTKLATVDRNACLAGVEPYDETHSRDDGCRAARASLVSVATVSPVTPITSPVRVTFTEPGRAALS
jgi:hypothetical protein